MARTIKTTHHVQYGIKPDEHHEAGKELVVGKDIESGLADELVSRGAAVEASPAAPKEPAAPVTLETFKAAVEQLDANNKDHFTNSGKPDCGALADVGCAVSAKERDALWAEMNPPE